MTELKTLKDLKHHYIPSDEEDDGLWIKKDDLKSETIKWIKGLRDHNFYCVICETFDCDCGSSDFFKLTSEKIESGLKTIFNIEEDDLK